MATPFTSNLFKYWNESKDVKQIDEEKRSLSGQSGSRSSSCSSFEFVSSLANSLPSLKNQHQPLLTDMEVIKIKAHCTSDNDVKSTTIDPNITSFASLYLLLKKAFNLASDFDISYLLVKSNNSTRPDVYLSLTSDWDLDAAFHTASYPMLNLKVDPVKKSDVGEWDVLEPVDVPSVQDIKSNNHHVPLTVSLKYDLTKTLGKVFEVFTIADKKHPLTEKEWVEYFDGNGRLFSARDLRIRVYHGGVEPSLRREAWPHILGVYPTDLTTEERTRFLFMKTQVYRHLKENWISRNPLEIESVTHMVQKDVLRTDRNHPFFNVREDHPNIVSLFNILTTFALNNPEVSYCQGMSDLAAPLLVVTEDETLAYLCFCKVMERLRCNFLLKGTALLQKFSQLVMLLIRTDEGLYKYLQDIEGDNLYFCYRMLLLELKREFPFTETLRVMEIIWSSMPPELDEDDSEVEFYYGLLHAGGNSKASSVSSGKSSPAPEGIYRESFGKACENDDTLLPHPRFLNDGSPFPLFLCLAVLLVNKEEIINKLDYAMLAMYFDKLSRKQDSRKIVTRAKALYSEYIRAFLEGQTVDPNSANVTLEGNHGTESTAAQC